jgi:alpha/beta superfamily hydrolase
VDEKVTFPAGDLTLEGRVWLATGGQDVGVVLCHPHPLRGGNMYSNVVSAVAEALWEHDISTLRFNFRGTGASTGVHGEGDTEGTDVAAAVTYLLSCQPMTQLVVAGYSFGAGVGLMAGAADARVTSLVGIAPPVGRRDISTLHTCTKAKLFVTGDRDHVCPLPVLQDLIAHYPEPKALALIPGADHFFLWREAEVAAAVVTFVKIVASVKQ